MCYRNSYKYQIATVLPNDKCNRSYINNKKYLKISFKSKESNTKKKQ